MAVTNLFRNATFLLYNDFSCPRQPGFELPIKGKIVNSPKDFMAIVHALTIIPNLITAT